MSEIDDRVNELITPTIELAKAIPNKFSTSNVQMKFKVGYYVAFRVVEELRRRGFVGEYDNRAGRCPVYLKAIEDAESISALVARER